MGHVVIEHIMLDFFISCVNIFQLDLKSVPDDKTCIDILQKWHIPSESGNTGAILFSELTFIKADQQKEENNSRKRHFVTEERYFCATSLFDQEVKVRKLKNYLKILKLVGWKQIL